ncbi:hypothetical protein LXL04_016990 [Taraxacum kok-saghyz]
MIHRQFQPLPNTPPPQYLQFQHKQFPKFWEQPNIVLSSNSFGNMNLQFQASRITRSLPWITVKFEHKKLNPGAHQLQFYALDKSQILDFTTLIKLSALLLVGPIVVRQFRNHTPHRFAFIMNYICV